jgi:hypothetical protein
LTAQVKVKNNKNAVDVRETVNDDRAHTCSFCSKDPHVMPPAI